MYDTLSFPASSYVPSRFYVRSGVSEPLVLPLDLQSGVERHAVVGRVLPSVDAASPKNIDLLSKMQAGSTLQLCGSNPSATETWNETRLKAYTVATAAAPLDLTHYQGIGMFVDGDGSGGTLVVRLTSGNVARDYAVPLTFTGKQWIEVHATYLTRACSPDLLLGLGRIHIDLSFGAPTAGLCVCHTFEVQCAPR